MIQNLYALERRIKKIIRQYCKVAVVQVRSQWSKYNEPNITGAANIDYEINDTVKWRISAEIMYSGQKAFLLEYGKGSLMDRANPAFAWYTSRSNGLYNRLRDSSQRIVGRPRGRYRDLDGHERFSSGAAAGRILEGKRPQYAASPPRHIVKHVLYGNGNSGIVRDMIKEIHMTILSYNFMKAFPKEIRIK